MTTGRRRTWRWAALTVALVGLAPACDAETGSGTAVTPAPPTSQAVSSGDDRPRASPRWEPVATFTGAAATATPTFPIAPDALQWRVRWRCDAGALRVASVPPPRRGDPIVDRGCPSQGEGFAIHSGDISLDVEASGPWEVVVEQQVDTALDEPPLPEMGSAQVLARGDFYEIENPGTGTAAIYGLGGGRRVLRLEGFETVATTDLFVWLSQAVEPRTSKEAIEAERVDLGPLRSTLGNQNYEIPAGVATGDIRSIVIWCEPIRIAYTAAALAAP